MNEEERQKLLQDIESKSTFAAELDSEVTFLSRCSMWACVALKKKKQRLNPPCFTGKEAQISSSSSHQEQRRRGTEVSAEDSRHGGADGKTQGKIFQKF